MDIEEDNKNAISQEHGKASTNTATTPAVVPNQEGIMHKDLGVQSMQWRMFNMSLSEHFTNTA